VGGAGKRLRLTFLFYPYEYPHRLLAFDFSFSVKNGV